MLAIQSLNVSGYLEEAILCIGSLELDKAFSLIFTAAPYADDFIQPQLKELMRKYEELSMVGRLEKEFLYTCTHKLNQFAFHLQYNR